MEWRIHSIQTPPTDHTPQVSSASDSETAFESDEADFGNPAAFGVSSKRTLLS